MLSCELQKVTKIELLHSHLGAGSMECETSGEGGCAVVVRKTLPCAPALQELEEGFLLP